MLSTLLGPAKPPVANADDVNSAGGLYRLVLSATGLTAEPVVATDAPMTVAIGERCLVCLCDYEASEQVRQLSCRHVYHRECIDEVSYALLFDLGCIFANDESVADDGSKLMSYVSRSGRGGKGKWSSINNNNTRCTCCRASGCTGLACSNQTNNSWTNETMTTCNERERMHMVCIVVGPLGFFVAITSRSFCVRQGRLLTLEGGWEDA
jgi:hypothetical protein